MNNLFNLSGKAAVVIGGAGYLGQTICEALAQYGASLTIASRNKERCCSLADEISVKYRIDAVGEYVDILDTGSIQLLFHTAANRFGKTDILINNAYISVPMPLEKMSDELWNRGIEGTVGGVFRCVREVLPYMIEENYGKIISIASMYGIMAPNPATYGGDSEIGSPACYGAGKAAVIQFTKHIAAYYGKRGILANCISPGSFPHADIQKNQGFMQKLGEKAMLGRIGLPEELKGAVVFLASDASSYVTGQNLCIDGGATSW
jgi:gluconate 5-dehydrogenase